MAGNISKQARNAVDEDLAVKQINPIIDYSLGTLFLLLVSKLFYECILDHSKGVLFISCLCAVIVVIQATRKSSRVIGGAISKFRTSPSLPVEARDPLRKKLTMLKFTDQAWQLFVHSTMTLFEVYLLQNKTWWEDPASTFDPCPVTFLEGEPSNQHSWELELFYMLQLAIWIWTCFSCQFLESRRKDYLQMMTHHIFTIILVLFSYLNQEHAIGLVVLVVHDGTDVLTDLLKMVNYLKLMDAHGFFITELFFMLNLCAWAYYRLYKFPLDIIYRGVWLGYGQKCGTEGDGVVARCYSAGTCFQSACLLSGLCVLHFYWFLLFLRILKKIVKGDTRRAGAENYEGPSGSDINSDNEASHMKSS